MRVVAIGLDAMERTLVEPLMDDGRLPNLAALRERAARCHLRNMVEYRSELPFTQFLTGKGAAANRYWSTVSFDPTTYTASALGALEARPFYALGPGTNVIQFDVPHSVLADDVEGIQIIGWGSHSPQYPRAAQPTGMLREIDARFGPHPAWGNDSESGWYEPDYIEALSTALQVGAERRVDVVEWLQRRVPDWDLILTVMSEPHAAGHLMWHGVDATHPLHRASTAPLARTRLVETYQAVDRAVGRLIDALPPDCAVVVFALHGMQCARNELPSLVLLPELLHRLWCGRPLLRNGERTAADADDPAPPLAPRRHERWIGYMQGAFCGRFRDDPTHKLRTYTPEPVLNIARRLTGRMIPPPVGALGWPIPPETDLPMEDIRPTYDDLRWQVPMWYRRHWASMPAFVLPSFSDTHVRINLQGRERKGIVPNELYRAAGEEVIDIASRCRDPRTHEPLLEAAIWTHDDDPMSAAAPDADLVLMWRHPVDAFDHPDVGIVGPFPYFRTGEHSSNGFAFVRAPGLEPADLGERSAVDVPPTILELLGHQPPGDMEGSSLIGAPSVLGSARERDTSG
jgi:predicted AlkP superfamily phosphohydrolase/phosphomutase